MSKGRVKSKFRANGGLHTPLTRVTLLCHKNVVEWNHLAKILKSRFKQSIDTNFYALKLEFDLMYSKISTNNIDICLEVYLQVPKCLSFTAVCFFVINDNAHRQAESRTERPCDY